MKPKNKIFTVEQPEPIIIPVHVEAVDVSGGVQIRLDGIPIGVFNVNGSFALIRVCFEDARELGSRGVCLRPALYGHGSLIDITNAE